MEDRETRCFYANLINDLERSVQPDEYYQILKTFCTRVGITKFDFIIVPVGERPIMYSCPGIMIESHPFLFKDKYCNVEPFKTILRSNNLLLGMLFSSKKEITSYMSNMFLTKIKQNAAIPEATTPIRPVAQRIQESRAVEVAMPAPPGLVEHSDYKKGPVKIGKIIDRTKLLKAPQDLKRIAIIFDDGKGQVLRKVRSDVCKVNVTTSSRSAAIDGNVLVLDTEVINEIETSLFVLGALGAKGFLSRGKTLLIVTREAHADWSTLTKLAQGYEMTLNVVTGDSMRNAHQYSTD